MLKVSLYGPARWYLCYIKFAHSSTQNIHLLLYRYLFAECYHGERENSKNLIPVKIPDLYSRCFFLFQTNGVTGESEQGHRADRHDENGQCCASQGSRGHEPRKSSKQDSKP